MKIVNICLILLLLGTFCSPGKYSPTIRFPYKWLGVQGLGGSIDQQNFPEPSGICYHPQRKTLFVVSDEGRISEIRTDGTPLFTLKIPGDLEGITVNPQTGLLYIAMEGEDVILEFDPDRREITRRFIINREFQGDSNFLQKQEENYDNGIESITFVPDSGNPEGGVFYVGNQWDPPCVMEVLVPLKSSRKEIEEARILRVLPLVMDDPAAMYYDYESRLLNVVSDADNILVEITLEGKIVNEYAFVGDNQEGIAIDDQGYMYIAQDSGGIIKIKDLR